MAILPNPPVEDAVCGEVDKSLILPCLLYETFYLFHRGEMPAQLNLHLIFNRGEAYSSGVMLKK
jgi:hypothetical protein